MEIQKVLHYHKALEKKTCKVRGDYFITEKIDGIYTYCDYDAVTKSWGDMRSSANRVIPAFAHYPQQLEKVRPQQACRLIFEADIPGTTFHIANGIFNRRKELAHDARFNLHDIVFFPNTQTALERMRVVQSFRDYGLLPVEVLGVSADESIWMHYFEQVTSRGGEGIVLKAVNGYYCPGTRNESLMKIKEEVTKDLLVVDIEHSIGTAGNIGLTLVSKGKNGVAIRTVINNTDLQTNILNDNSYILGKIIEVTAMRELENGSLREPRFKSIRYDKLEKDID